MKKLLTTLAVLTVITGPAFALDYNPDGDNGQVFTSTDFSIHAPAANAHASAPRRTRAMPQVSIPAFDVQGDVVGADPDANVRLELRRDDIKDY